ASSPLQYTVELVDLATVGDRGGLAAGVDPQSADALGAPLPDEADGPGLPAGQGTPYAALQAFQSGGSDLITVTAEPAAESRELAGWVRNDVGWSALTGQAYVLAASSDTPEPFATRDTTPDKQTPQLIAAGVISAVLLLALVLWLRRRPKRV